MVAIVDYGAGNLFSVANALEHLGRPLSNYPGAKGTGTGGRYFLPGVGAFPDAMEMLQEKGLVPLLRHMALEKPFLGICLGMQVLIFTGRRISPDTGPESFTRTVEKLRAPALKFPYGWKPSGICAGLPTHPGASGRGVRLFCPFLLRCAKRGKSGSLD